LSNLSLSGLRLNYRPNSKEGFDNMTDNSHEHSVLSFFTEIGVRQQNDHFVLSQGDHASDFVDKRVINQFPLYVTKVARLMHELCPLAQLDPNTNNLRHPIDTVVGLADGAITLSFALAFLLGPPVNHTWASKVKKIVKIDHPTLVTSKRSVQFEINPANLQLIDGKRILIVEDVLTTGESLAKAASLIADHGGLIVGAVTIWNRNQVTAENCGVPLLNSLLNIRLPSWPAANCHLCQQGVPINTRLGHGANFLERQAAKR
jgi:orotate phosphoribosyltransferase